MRVRTEDRRQAIMQAALCVFREVGYERASMSEIAARLGGSKATLYGYFKSKQELYAAAMVADSLEEVEVFLSALDPERPDIDVVMETFGVSYLKFVTSADLIAKQRNTMSQGPEAELGPLLYERGPKHSWSRVAAYLEQLMQDGALRQGDPEIAALHLQGLLEAGIVQPCLFRAPPRLTIERAASLAVDVFLRAYGEPRAG
jgi:AcrR family transcriptional regulator